MGSTKISAKDVLEIWENELGYIEKASNFDLDSKTGNAGSNNYTKYSRDLLKWVGSPYANGVPWCDIIFDWCIVKACIKKCGNEKDGIALAKSILGGWSAYTPTSAQYYKNMGRFGAEPKIGAQIFFKNVTTICHTGIVSRIENGYVYTYEGNTSSAPGVVANGGCVRQKSYSLSYPKIAGYGYLDYSENEAEESKENNKSKKYKELIKKLQNALNAEYKVGISAGGVPGIKTLNATPTLNKKIRKKKPKTVKALQRLLKYYGYKCEVDGDFYVSTEKMVKNYQKEIVGQKNPDGEVTAKNVTWRKLLNL